MPAIALFLNHFLPKEEAESKLKKMAESLVHETWHNVYMYSSPPFYFSKVDIGLLNKETSPAKSDDGEFEVFLIGEFDMRVDTKKSLLKETIYNLVDDTQFLLALFQKYDIQFVDYVRGDFVAIIWQPRQKRLCVAADRVGQHNIYYYYMQDKVILSSEVKPVLKYGNDVKPDMIGSCQLLYFGHLISDRTLFQEIKCLQANELILFEKNRFNLKKRSSYYFTKDNLKLSNDDWSKKIAEEIKLSILEQCKSNLKPAITLSGGKDSRIVLAGFPESYYPIHAYTWGINGHHETKIAAKICEKLGVEHTIYQTPFDDVLDRVKKTVLLTDGMLPAFKSIHNLNHYLIREKEEVVFFGFELVGMYNKFKQLKRKLFVSDLLDHFPLEVVINLFKTKFHKSFIEDLKESMQTFINDLNYQDQNDTRDHLILFCREKRRDNLGVVVMRNFTEAKRPLSSERLLKLVTSMPLKVRQSRRIYEKSLFYLNEELWNIPEDKTVYFSYNMPLCIRQKVRFFINARNRSSGYLQKWSGRPLYLGNYPHNNIPKLLMTDKKLQHDIAELLTGPDSCCKEYLNMSAVETELKNQFAGKNRQMPQLSFLLTFEYWLRIFVEQ